MWRNNHLDQTQLELLNQSTIDLGGEVDEDMILYVREALLRLTVKGSPSITVLITSRGGSVEVGLDIYDALRLYTGEKTGIVLGFAKSMAVLILQACEKRKCMRHATLLIHHISRREVSLDILRDPIKLKEVRDDLEASQSRLYVILGARTCKTVDVIREECAKERDMTAEEALAFGLVDEVI